MKPGSLLLAATILTAFLNTASCGPAQEPTTTTPNPTSLDGAVLFAAYCAECHGSNAEGTDRGARITPDSPAILNRTEEQLISLVQFHRAALGLSRQQAVALAGFLRDH
jgi:mono/diheme cytochrome c family protein